MQLENLQWTPQLSARSEFGKRGTPHRIGYWWECGGRTLVSTLCEKLHAKTPPGATSCLRSHFSAVAPLSLDHLHWLPLNVVYLQCSQLSSSQLRQTQTHSCPGCSHALATVPLPKGYLQPRQNRLRGSQSSAPPRTLPHTCMCSELTAGLGGSYLLVPGSSHVSCIGIRPGAGHSTEATVQALGPSRTSAGLCACPLSCLLLPVLLSFQVIPIGLEQSEVAWVTTQSSSAGCRAG